MTMPDVVVMSAPLLTVAKIFPKEQRRDNKKHEEISFCLSRQPKDPAVQCMDGQRALIMAMSRLDPAKLVQDNKKIGIVINGGK